MLTIPGSKAGTIEGMLWPLSESEDLHFDNESDIHVSSKNYEANGKNICDLDLLVVLH